MLECVCEAVEAALPEVAVAGEPGFELAEGLGSEAIQALLSEGAHGDEAGLTQYAQVSGYAGLVDAGVFDDVTHGFFAALEGLDDAASGGVGESFEGVYMHGGVYVYHCMVGVKRGRADSREAGARRVWVPSV